jgi:hypothetical protein
MTGRERVRATLLFDRPDRVPRDLWSLRYVNLFQQDELDRLKAKYPMDISSSQPSPGWDEKVVQATAKAGSYIDDWGSVWRVGEPGVVGEVWKPTLKEWSGLKSFRAPWRLIEQRDKAFVDAACESSDKFMLSDVTARPFERLQFLRGSENLFYDIGEDREEMHKLLTLLHEFYLSDIAWWCSTKVDAVFFMDDWGSNRSLLIDPKTWRKLFKPLYREYCDIIHAAGKFAFFHSDGNTEAIFGDLVEIGIDAINSQLFCMDIEGLAEKYRGRITFWGEIDHRTVLPFGTEEEVRRAVVRVKSALGGGKGGVVAQCEWGKNNPARNIEAVFQAWSESGN